MNQKLHPRVLWFTGYSGAGKSTLAAALQADLERGGTRCAVLDGDVVRHGLCRDLGFSAEDRAENIRRVAEVAKILSDAGLVTLCALISPLEKDREIARQIVGADRFREVHVCTPLDVCEHRDPKGLYRRARAADLKEFTGVSAPYEPPSGPALRLDTSALSLEACLVELRQLLEPGGR